MPRWPGHYMVGNQIVWSWTVLVCAGYLPCASTSDKEGDFGAGQGYAVGCVCVPGGDGRIDSPLPTRCTVTGRGDLVHAASTQSQMTQAGWG